MRVYLAGPDVFYPDAAQRYRKLKAIAKRYGFNVFTPVDGTLPTDTTDLSQAIFNSNHALLNNADAVLANLSPFRGAEPDSGTVWEAAFAIARGKLVVGYIQPYETLLARAQRLGMADGYSSSTPVDNDGLSIENFGLPLNLMLMHGLTAIVDSYEEACRLLDMKATHQKGLSRGFRLA